MAVNPDPTDLTEVTAILNALPRGSFTGTAADRRYLLTKTLFSGGRAVKLVAEEMGGVNYISLNFYQLRSGPRLFPCEMPRAKVIAFLQSLRVAGQDDA
ncbi:hypothetical protein [uncultured Roseobacter sp.]|uniref:hypothetical protein n=1 Tax=uncultured Roseobacter sp. TaxID=114847 RepID=UPI0026335811|nr:hypothetical protein [uncultured Roseobacter sp.]